MLLVSSVRVVVTRSVLVSDFTHTRQRVGYGITPPVDHPVAL